LADTTDSNSSTTSKPPLTSATIRVCPASGLASLVAMALPSQNGVIRLAGLEGEFADGDAPTGGEMVLSLV